MQWPFMLKKTHAQFAKKMHILQCERLKAQRKTLIKILDKEKKDLAEVIKKLTEITVVEGPIDRRKAYRLVVDFVPEAMTMALVRENDERLQDLIDKIKSWPDIDIEIVGDWLWVKKKEVMK